MEKIALTGITLDELRRIVSQMGQEEFRSRQIFSWIYQKQECDFLKMSNLPEGLRLTLQQKFTVHVLAVAENRRSVDNTEKFLFSLSDGALIESVIIPAEGRITACISTQVGCKFSCRFCASGLSGFKRNLSCAEIIDQVLQLLLISQAKKITHIVFMGTGEPLDNYDNVLKAIRILNSADALHIGARRITISSSGFIPGIRRLADEGLQIELSISLHAADDATRTALMPINKKYPLKDLLATCREYIQKTNRQITFEYILIQGLNSDLKSAKKLCTLLTGLNCKINLIPANPVRELRINPPEKPEILLFKNTLLKSSLNVTLRKERGRDIEAACGQLRLKYEHKKVD